MNTKSKEVQRLEEVMFELTGEKKDYTDTTANGLSKCIIDFVQVVKGQHCEFVYAGGVPFIDKKTGKQRFAKPKTTNGTSDLSACISTKNGRYRGVTLKIEIKIGEDYQKSEQKKYQKSIENAGGLYVIARDFADFSWYFKKTFEQ